MRSDLLRYEFYKYYEANEAICVVARNDVGSFDVLKIDRTARLENLVMSVERFSDETEFYRAHPYAAECRHTLPKVGSSRSSTDSSLVVSKSSQTKRAMDIYGIIGFVRFLYGYYVLVITKKSKVATIGHHSVYEVDQVEAIYIPMPQIGVNDANELRYLKTFQNVNLTNNFYLSYTYDLTRTVQSWLDGPPVTSFNGSYDPKYTWNNYLFQPMTNRMDDAACHRWILPMTHGFVGQGNVNIFGRHIYITLIARRSRHFAGTRYLKRGISSEGYVANEVETEQIVFENPTLALSDTQSKLLLTDGIGLLTSYVQMRGSVPALWTQDLAQMSMVGPPPISVFGYDLGMQLAGRHFSQLLSRYGAPVVVFDLVKTSQKSKRSQASAMNSSATPSTTTSNQNSAKQQSNQNPANPNAQFVSPSEAQKEALLHEALIESVNYLNQFMDPAFRIQYIHIDLAHLYRRDPTGVNTVRRLLDVGERVIANCDICVAFTGQRQHGVLRTNCVDCLDRTNAAQLAAGLVALGHQFYALGATPQPVIELDSYCFRLFEMLFEEMGDMMALQYGSSLLVHHFATYRRAAPWISQSRDKFEQVSRLLNNTFSDADRQMGKNLLLGMYRPFDHHRGSSPGQAIWDMTSDYDLHNPVMEIKLPDGERRRRLVQWFDLKMLRHLPYPEPILTGAENGEDEEIKTLQLVKRQPASRDPAIDSFTIFFQPNSITFFEDLHDLNVPNTLQLTPAGGILLADGDLDPFVPRVRRVGASSSNPSNAGAGSLIRRFLQYSSSNAGGGDAADAKAMAPPLIKQPSLDAFDSSPLVSAGGAGGGPHSEGESDDSQDDYVIPDSASIPGNRVAPVKSPWPSTTFATIFKSPMQLYGIDFTAKSKDSVDVQLFKRYCYMADFKPSPGIAYTPLPIEPISGNAFKPDIDFLNTTVPEESLRIYEAYVRSSPGRLLPSSRDMLWQPEDRSHEYVAYMKSGVAF